MAQADPQQILTAYDPTFISMDRRGVLIEEKSLESMRSALCLGASGGADTYYSSFEEGLKNLKGKTQTGGGDSGSGSVWDAAVFGLPDDSDEDVYDDNEHGIDGGAGFPCKYGIHICAAAGNTLIDVGYPPEEKNVIGGDFADSIIECKSELEPEGPTAIGAMDELNEEDENTYEIVELGGDPIAADAPDSILDSMVKKESSTKEPLHEKLASTISASEESFLDDIVGQ